MRPASPEGAGRGEPSRPPDTLSGGPTLRSAGGAPGSEGGVPRLEDDLNLAQTVRGLRPGQKVFDRYTLNRVLGRGAMGVVWQAKDEKLGHDVALKFLPEVLTLNAGAKDELKEETKRALKLTHNHIVRIYDFVEQSDCAAIAMEYVDGDTLASLRLHRPDKVFTVKEAGPWVEELCDALMYAHFKAKVVHRDLKPVNLMVDARNELKIMDFGIARSLSDTMTRLTRPGGEVSGTLAYMSPQQMMGSEPTAQDDIYALGATIYELLTGRPPFYSGDIASQAQNKVPPTMTERRKQLQIAGGGPIPKEWEEVVAACLAKKATQRPQTAAEVARRLGLRAETAGAAAHEAPRPAGGSKLPLVAASLVLLAALAGGAWFLTHKPKGGAAGGSCELRVSTDPTAATVTLDQETQTSPAHFAGLQSGTHQLQVVKPGYDPLVQEVSVTGTNGSLGPLKLVRSTGVLALESDLESVPFTLTGSANQLPSISGMAPTNIAGLPTGEYTLTAGAGDLAMPPRTVKIDAKQTTTEKLTLPGGWAVIQSDPRDADVIQGKDTVRGKTPLTLPMPPGTAEFKLTLQRYQPTTLTVEVKAGQTSQYNVKLVQLGSGPRYDVTIQTEPPQAIVKLQGVSKPSPAEFKQLEPATYELQVSKAGYEDYSQRLIITQSGAVDPIRLTRSTGSLVIRSEPPGANYTLTDVAGKEPPIRGVATAEAAPKSVPTGAYRLKASLGDFNLPERTVEVARNQKQDLSLLFALGYMQLTSKPAGAEVYNGTNYLGTTPVRALLSSTPQTLTFKAPGHDLKSELVTARVGVTGVLEAVLAPIPPEAPLPETYTNSLGMIFKRVAVRGAAVHFCVHETRVKDFAAFNESRGQMSYRPSFERDQKPDHPVVGITWQSATEFCKWLTEKERKEKVNGVPRISTRQAYRLPTDAEWSAAVGLPAEVGSTPLERGDPRTMPKVFPWGAQWPPTPGFGNYGGEETVRNAKDGRPDIPIPGYVDKYPYTAPVMDFKPNAYGLYDLSGNVWEWVQDRYSDTGEARTLRGGSWFNYQADSLYSGARLKEAPDNPRDFYGFRVVLGPVEP